jgi:hypothetical protein
MLSADVAIDPVFGIYGYGCDVKRNGSHLVITPKDGLFKRLNLISQKLSIVLDQDIYSQATISESNDYIELELQNTKKSVHTTTIQVKGLPTATYTVLIDNKVQGTFTSQTGTESTVRIPVGSTDTYNVKIQNSSTGILRYPRSNTFCINHTGNSLIVTPSDQSFTDHPLSLRIYDVQGRLVAVFKDFACKEVIWSPRVYESGSGTYIVHLTRGDETLIVENFLYTKSSR